MTRRKVGEGGGHDLLLSRAYLRFRGRIPVAADPRRAGGRHASPPLFPFIPAPRSPTASECPAARCSPRQHAHCERLGSRRLARSGALSLWWSVAVWLSDEWPGVEDRKALLEHLGVRPPIARPLGIAAAAVAQSGFLRSCSGLRLPGAEVDGQADTGSKAPRRDHRVDRLRASRH